MSISSYLSTLPHLVVALLENQLDWDHDGADDDLNEIAENMAPSIQEWAHLLISADDDIAEMNESNHISLRSDRYYTASVYYLEFIFNSTVDSC